VTNKTNSFYKRTTILLPLLLISLGLIFTVSVNNVSAAPGDTIYVNDSSGNDASDGSSWILAKKSIKNATNNVNVNGKVNIADGQYKGINNTNITITKNMNIIGQSQTGTIINGTDTNWIFYIKSGNVTITNLTLTNGTNGLGGAIENDATLTINNCTFTNNSAANGGAIYNQGTLTATNSNFTSNTANSTVEDVYGGGIYNEGTLTINNNTITNNTATGTNGFAYGGGIYNSGTLIINNNTITNNTATTTDGYADGGGISNDEDSTLTITDTTIKDNIAIGTSNAYGGGISHSFLSNVTINNSIITNNTATAIGGNAYGGGISNWGAFLTINNSTITGNTATATNGNAYGGGISNNGDSTITDTTIKDNIAIGTNNAYGGGIYNYGTLIINNNTITNNTATTTKGYADGGGISNDEDSTLTITDTTIKDNIAIGTNNAYGGGISSLGAFITINNSTITGNTATATNGNAYGGGIYNEGTLTVVNCSIENNNAGDGGGIFNWYGNLKVISSTLTNNTASMEGNAISNYGPADNNIPVELHFNRIIGNGKYTLYSNSNMLNATDNWWGSNNPNFSTIISGVVNYTPWLYLTFTAAPLSIQQGSTSTLTASFNQVFDGTTITQLDPLLGHIPDGTPVTFTTDLGNVGSKSVVKYTLNGIATAILRADEAAGSALVSAFADSQTPLTRTVTITPVANAATSTSVQAGNIISMQDTGTPIVPLAIAVFSILGGLVANRRK
jgi:autotransporter family porin